MILKSLVKLSNKPSEDIVKSKIKKYGKKPRAEISNRQSKFSSILINKTWFLPPLLKGGNYFFCLK